MADIQAEIRQVFHRLSNEIDQVETLQKSLSLDETEIPEEMITWEICPSLAFYVHGLLSIALRDLDDAKTRLTLAADVTSEQIRSEWELYRAEGQAVDDTPAVPRWTFVDLIALEIAGEYNRRDEDSEGFTLTVPQAEQVARRVDELVEVILYTLLSVTLRDGGDNIPMEIQDKIRSLGEKSRQDIAGIRTRVAELEERCLQMVAATEKTQ